MCSQNMRSSQTKWNRIRQCPIDMTVSSVLLPSKKKRHYNNPIIKWNLDLKINYNDIYILKQIVLSIESSRPDSNCFDINKNIAEYALGIIKNCPCCVNDEILIIQSSFDDFEQPIYCNKCNQKLFIHTCSDCQFNEYKYYNPAWWISSDSMSQTQSYPIPELNTCQDCALLTILPRKLQDTLDEGIVICPEICSQCKFECDLCGLIFCKKRHSSYCCDECLSCYCSTCHHKIQNEVYYHLFEDDKDKKCINCCYKLANINLNTKYPKLQQRWLITYIHYYFPKIIESLPIIPLKVLQFIIGYTKNDYIHNCAHDDCADNDCQIYLPDDNFFLPARKVTQCKNKHFNYQILCNCHCDDSICDGFDIISPLKYLLYSDTQWYINWVSPLERQVIEEEVCDECYIENKMRITIPCIKCGSWCYHCHTRFCDDHMVKCNKCLTRCCWRCNDENNQMNRCCICFDIICLDCWDGIPNINELDNTLPKVCSDCYSPYIKKYCKSNHDLRKLGLIIELIYFDPETPNSIVSGQTPNIVSLISMYLLMLM